MDKNGQAMKGDKMTDKTTDKITDKPADKITAPFRLTNERVWRTYTGGKLLGEFHGEEGPEDGHFPEEWIASTVAARNAGREWKTDEGLTRLSEKPERYLRDVLQEAPEQLLGKAHAERFGSSMGVLVKLIDSSERLTIQVHPDRQQAMRLFQSAYGKTECWRILGGRFIDGQQPCIYIGFKEGVSREYWQQLFEQQNIQGMLDCLHSYPVKEGDTILIRGGVPHAIGAGCFLVEIQEPTDYTIRVERHTPSGLKVEDTMCHQGIGFDRMFECFHYEGLSWEENRRSCFLEPQCISQSSGGKIIEVVSYDDTPFFRMEEIAVEGYLEDSMEDLTEDPMEDPAEDPAEASPEIKTEADKEDTFAVLYVISGQGKLITASGELQICAGEQYFLPAGIGRLSFCRDRESSEELKLMRCFGPKTT